LDGRGPRLSDAALVAFIQLAKSGNESDRFENNGGPLMATLKPKPHVGFGRRDAGDAFFPDPAGGRAFAPDELAEELAEEFLAAATSGEGQGEEAHEQFVDEEVGGPFVTTRAKQEFAHGYDDSNFLGAERESLPMPGPVTADWMEEEDGWHHTNVVRSIAGR
jgi:hypothetical protein